MAAAISLPLPELTAPQNPELDFCMQSSVDDLCDQLTVHILDCDSCFSGREHDCARYVDLRKRLAAHGGVQHGAAMAF